MATTLKVGTRPPWVGLGASVWLQVASGSGYTFPLYSHSLKSVLGFTQHQLTMLGVANDVGENVGLLPGLACNKLPPWVVLMVGALACFSGYGVLWLSLSRTVQNLPYWLLWAALCIATNSSAWLSTAVLVTNMRNFPRTRGTVAGILKGYGGLSAAVFTEIYGILLRHSSSNLLAFLSVGIPILCFSMMYFVRPCTPASGEDPWEHSHFLFIQATSVVLGLFLLSTTVMGDILSFTATISFLVISLMIILLMAPLAVPVKMTLFRSRARRSETLEQQVVSSGEIVHDDVDGKSTPLLGHDSSASLGSFRDNDDPCDVDILLAEGEGAVKKKRRPKRGEDFTFLEAIVKADFWLLFLVYFVGVGSGVTVLNNMAQIGIAQGAHDTTLLLSFFSFGNFVGRLGGGVLSEHFVRTRTMPRTVWMSWTQAIMILIYLIFAYAFKGTLLVVTALLGICYGIQFSIMVPTVSEIFGLKHFGLLLGFISLGNPVGAFLFSGLLAGYIYDKEAAKQHGVALLKATTVSCLGPDCFRITFLVLAGVSSLGVVLSIILSIRIKPVYQMLYSGGSFRQPQSSNH
ncbi:hypothetical protein MLD38_014439 [Melastoma candidum]|uniref:Uncharacterized protein n=1 Tax=Melastoma candidum TaxID=119954 RepID=A0ACB9REN6_9MYRT|nr:hypothetical protein MLD38_014439 [Melastoma candidum]